MSYRFLLVAFLLCLTAGPAFAGPPLLTDDPDTPGDKHWEINTAFTLDKRNSSTTMETPILDLNYGVGDNIQLKYEVPMLVRHEQGIGTQGGLGNSLVGVKWRFLDEDKFGINMSSYPQLEFNPPTTSADRGLVDRGANLLLPVEASKKFGPVREEPDNEEKPHPMMDAAFLSGPASAMLLRGRGLSRSSSRSFFFLLGFLGFLGLLMFLVLLDRLSFFLLHFASGRSGRSSSRSRSFLGEHETSEGDGDNCGYEGGENFFHFGTS